MNKTVTLIIFIVIVGLSGLMMLGILTNHEDWGADYAGFISQAKSIIEGSPRDYLESNRFTIEQSSEPMGPVAYPWGYPLLLAPIYRLFGLNYLALKSVAAISYLLLLVVMWYVFRKSHSPFWFLLLVSLFAFNSRMLAYTNEIYSDLPFLLLSTISVWLIQEIIVHDKRIFSSLADYILIGITITTAFLIRTNGILLLATLGFSQIISGLEKKSNKQQSLPPIGTSSPQKRDDDLERTSIFQLLVKFSPYILFLLSVIIWRSFLPEGGNSHLPYLKNISVDSITKNLLIYAETSLEFFNGVPVPFLLMGASVPLAIAGAFRRYRSEYPAIFYILITLGLYIIWPYNIRFRFLFPMLPFFFSYVFSGLESFFERSTKREKFIRKVVAYVPVFFVIFFFLFNNQKVIVNRIRGNKRITSGPYAPSSQEMLSFIENHTETDSVIIFMKPRLMNMLTDRQSIRIINVDELSRGDYLIFYLEDDFRRSYQISDTETDLLLEQGSIERIFKNQDFKIYRLDME